MRYLFFDSLCIIQDDQDDVHTQIEQMSDIFSEATVTILASRVRSVETGFLHERPFSLASYDDSREAWRYQGVSEMGIRCPTGEIGSVILLGSQHTRPGELLRTRAWVLQEELLAHRTLEYGPDQTVWACRSPHRLVDGWLDNFGWYEKLPERVTGLFRSRLLPKAGKKTGNLEKREDILDLWHGLVGEYSKRDLTEPNDKLSAIGAIGQHVGDDMQDDDYLAGIWKWSIPHDLFWTLRWSRYPRPKDFRALSWSWAAVDGMINIPEYTSRPCSLEVLECHTKLAFPDARFGAVTAGHLKVRGRLRRVILLDLDYEGEDSKGLFRVKEPGGPEFVAPLPFDAVEQEFSDNLQQPLEIALLEMYGAGEVTRSGLVLREVGSQKFSRLGLFSWQFEPDIPDDISETSSEEGQRPYWFDDLMSYWDWILGFDQYDKVEITLI